MQEFQSTQLTWIRQPGRFQQNVIKRAFTLHQFLDGSHASVLDATAQAAIGQFKNFLRLFCSRIIRRGYVDGFCYLDIRVRLPESRISLHSMS